MTILLVHLVDSAVSDSGSPLAIDAANAGAPRFIRGRKLEFAFRCSEVAVRKESSLYCLGFVWRRVLSHCRLGSVKAKKDILSLQKKSMVVEAHDGSVSLTLGKPF